MGSCHQSFLLSSSAIVASEENCQIYCKGRQPSQEGLCMQSFKRKHNSELTKKIKEKKEICMFFQVFCLVWMGLFFLQGCECSADYLAARVQLRQLPARQRNQVAGEQIHEAGELIHLQLKTPFKTSPFCVPQLLNLSKCPFFSKNITTQDLTCRSCCLNSGQHQMF